MPITTLKKIADFEIKESTKQLVDYVNDINHPEKNKLNTFYLKEPEHLYHLVSEIMVFYYIFCFSLSKNFNGIFLDNFISLLKQKPLYSKLFEIYSNVIDIEEINPHLNPDQIKAKKEEILQIKEQISL